MDDTIQENDTLTNELENLDSPNEEEKDTLKNTDESASEDDSFTEDKEKQTLLAQKEHYRAKVEKLEAKLKELNPKVELTQKQGDSTYDPLEIVKLGQAVKDLSVEELEFVTKVAKSSKPQDLIAATNDEWVKRAISSHREELAKNNKVPNPSSPSGVSIVKDLVALAKDPSISDEEIDKKTRELFQKEIKKQEAIGI